MSSTLIKVPSGTTSAVYPLLANQNICACPAVQGGSVQINVGSNPAGPFSATASGSTTAAQSYRPDVNQYVTITAAGGQAANAVISDMSIPSMQGALVSAQAPFDSPNSTSEVLLYSFRLAPFTLPASFRVALDAKLNMTNSANAKNVNCRMNGIAGNLFFQAPSLANVANYNFLAWFNGIGDGATLEGYGSGTTGGLGTSGTAYTTLTRAYQQLETEICLTVQKATGTETMTLDSLNVTIA